MPRINIEDKLYRDIRFANLAIKLKSRAMALGCLIGAWTLAQEYWKRNRLVPKTKFMEIECAQEILDCALAVIIAEDEDFVYVKGSKKEFDWLVKCSEGGKKNKKIKNNAHPEIIKEKMEGALSVSKGAEALPLTPSPSPSPTPTHSHKEYILSDSEKSNDMTWLVDLYNQMKGDLPAVSRLTYGTKRYKNVKRRLSEIPDKEKWIEIFQKVQESDFLSGRDGKWLGMSFDWIFKNAENPIKILEGVYSRNAVSKKEKVSTVNQEMARRVISGEL
jgi:hypothetical protein